MINNKLKTAMLLVTLAIPMTLSGCKDSGGENKIDKEKLLIQTSWEHYNANIGETEGVFFNKDNEYFYSCSCGEPVGDSDLYDIYSYDGNNTITLKASYEDGPEDKNLNILYIDDMTLLLDMGDDIVEFFNEDKMPQCLHASYEETCDDCIAYLEEYDGYSTILSISEEGIEIAPANYDGDTDDMFKDYKRIVKLTDDIKFYSLSAESSFKDEERVSHECSYTELTKDEVTTMLEDGNGSALTWYNDEGHITKILFYGTTSVYE